MLRVGPEDGRVPCAWQRLALAHHFLDERDLAKDRCEQALEIAEREGLDAEVARIRSLLYSTPKMTTTPSFARPPRWPRLRVALE